MKLIMHYYFIEAIGCRVNFTLEIGEKIIINSPKYPANYGLLENCMWIISGINGRTVYVEFKDFITENRYDIMKVMHSLYEVFTSIGRSAL